MSSAAAAAQFSPDFQFSAEGSEKRKKVDFKSSFESPDCNWRNSLAWDTAFFTSPGILELDELFETLNIGDDKKKQSTAQQQYDSRRSLAWDSAFLNSAGVLDAEELSIVNRGFRCSDAKPMTGFEQEVWRSVESTTSTANSDGSSSLASLEIDLFTDIKGQQFNQKLQGFSSRMQKEMVVQEGNGNGGSSTGRPPRMSIRGVSPSSSTTTESRRASLKGSHGGSKGKTRTIKSTPNSKSPSSVLPVTGNGSFAIETPPLHSRRSVATTTTTSVPSFRTPLKFLAGLRNGSLSSSSSSLRSSSLSSRPKVSPVSSISQLLTDASSQASESKVPHSRFGSSTAPQTTKKSANGSSPFPAATKLQASGLKMPSPKLGYFDPDNPSGSVRRGGNLRSKSEQPRMSDATASINPGRTSLGKHRLTGNHISFSLNTIKSSDNNEQWEECFNSNNMKKKKKKRCLKEDAKVPARENCSCSKRPENNKENSIAVASSNSSSNSFDSHVKPVRFSPVWK